MKMENKKLELWPFSYFCPMRKKWFRARYVATLDDIGQRYGAFKLTGKPEIRDVPRDPSSWFPTKNG